MTIIFKCTYCNARLIALYLTSSPQLTTLNNVSAAILFEGELLFNSLSLLTVISQNFSRIVSVSLNTHNQSTEEDVLSFLSFPYNIQQNWQCDSSPYCFCFYSFSDASCQSLTPLLKDKMDAGFYSTWRRQICTPALFAVTTCCVFCPNH